MFLKLILLGVLLPAVVSGVVFWLEWQLGRRESAWPGALALGLAYGAGHWGVIGWPAFPPVDVTHWLPYLALAAMLFGLRDGLWPMPVWQRWALRLTLTGGTLWLLLRPLARNSWTGSQTVWWLAGLGAAFLIVWWQVDTLAERTRGAAIPLALMVLGTGTSIALVLGRSALLGQLAGALTAALGAAWVVSWFHSGLRLARGAVPVIVVLLAGFWLSGYFYAEVPAVTVALLWLAPAGLWAGEWSRAQSLKPWQGALVRAAAVLVPMALALGWAYRDWVAAAAEYPYY